MRREVAKDISYASSAETKSGRALIRVLENATGRLGLIKRANGYQDEVANGRVFWDVIVERFGLRLDVIKGSLSNIPTTGPVIVVANHPYGILDGLMMGQILSQVRGDFRILANSVFRKAEELNRVILPISFDTTKEALAENIQTRKTALEYLAAGGAVGVFPGGTVSTSAKMFGTPMDPGWRNFTAKMIARSDATVVPIFFEGHNSRLFQLASHMHQTLRLALLIKEFKARVDNPVRVAVGDPIPATSLAEYRSDPNAMMDFLRHATYELSLKPLKSYDRGYEFEAKYRA